MSYLMHSVDYENRVIKAMTGPQQLYRPSYSEDMDESVIKSYWNSLNQAIGRTIEHVNCEYPWAFIAFSEYLHDRYKVPAVDCDFLVQLFNGSLGDAIDKVTNHLARVQAREFDTYIDWDRYYADHPERRQFPK